MRNKKTPMRRAFIEVGDENFISVEQVASDPSMRAAAIASLKREIGGLSRAEKRVAKNTLHFLRSVRDGTANGRGAVRVFFAATSKALGRVAFATRKTVDGIEAAIRRTLSGIALAISKILTGVEFAIRRTLGGVAFAGRKTAGGIEFAIRATLGVIAFAIRKAAGGIEFAIGRTVGGVAFVTGKSLDAAAFAIRRIHGGIVRQLVRMRRVFAPGA